MPKSQRAASLGHMPPGVSMGESVAVFCWGGGWAFYFINETTSRYTRSTAIKIHASTHARALLYLLSSFFYSLV
jgi:hypothetical protein